MASINAHPTLTFQLDISVRVCAVLSQIFLLSSIQSFNTEILSSFSVIQLELEVPPVHCVFYEVMWCLLQCYYFNFQYTLIRWVLLQLMNIPTA